VELVAHEGLGHVHARLTRHDALRGSETLHDDVVPVDEPADGRRVGLRDAEAHEDRPRLPRDVPDRDWFAASTVELDEDRGRNESVSSSTWIRNHRPAGGAATAPTATSAFVLVPEATPTVRSTSSSSARLNLSTSRLVRTGVSFLIIVRTEWRRRTYVQPRGPRPAPHTCRARLSVLSSDSSSTSCEHARRARGNVRPATGRPMYPESWTRSIRRSPSDGQRSG
jgi:hypothetical protein